MDEVAQWIHRVDLHITLLLRRLPVHMILRCWPLIDRLILQEAQQAVFLELRNAILKRKITAHILLQRCANESERCAGCHHRVHVGRAEVLVGWAFFLARATGVPPVVCCLLTSRRLIQVVMQV